MDATIAYLKSLGHHLNPAIRKFTVGIGEDDWQNVGLTSAIGQAMLASFQEFMGEDHEELCRAHHGRAAHHDGELGPATLELLDLPRCGHPDYVEPATDDDEARTGNGSWRAGCLADYPGIHALYYHVDTNRRPSQIAAWWPEASKRVNEAYAEIGLKWVETNNRSQAQVRISWEPLAGSTIGLAQLPPLRDAQTCYTGFFCKFDPSYRPNLNQIATLDAHERGHNCKSGHITNDPIMHPSIRTGWNGSFRGTAFGDRLSGYFGGEPIPGDPDDPPPTPGGGTLIIGGDLHIMAVEGDVLIKSGERFPVPFRVKQAR